MVLKQDRSRLAGIATEAGRRVVLGDLDVVVDLDAIVINGNPTGLHLFAVLALRRGELDVIRLPDRRRLAGVDLRFRDAVDTAAITLTRLGNAIAVQHLHFVAPLQVDAAVAATLAGLLRLVRNAKLDMQLE